MPGKPFTLQDALGAAQETRCLEIAAGAIQITPQFFRQHFGDRPAIIVADSNTFRAAGEEVLAAFCRAKHPVVEPFVFRAPDLHAQDRFVVELVAALRNNKAVPVAVGSGTINDLTKLSSHRTDRPYMCVPTAASMDGYTSFGASVVFEGAKQTIPCPAPVAVVADLDVICAAPGEMNAWGYADLLAKIPAGADWIVADALGIDPINRPAWTIVQGRIRELLADPGGVRRREPAAIRNLVEGLMLGGFAMQLARSTRVASGAEHLFSHIWDMEHHTHNGQTPSHGFKVGIGTLAVTALFERLLTKQIEKLDVDACCAAWPDESRLFERANALFSEDVLVSTATQETRAKHCSPEQLRGQLRLLKAVWPDLCERLRAQLLPLLTLRQMLRDVGAPTEPEQIGITPQRLRKTFWQASCMRRRYTGLDIIVRAQLLDICLDEIFGESGVWPIT